VLFVKGNRYAPFKCGSRNAQVFKTGFDKVVYKLLGAGLGMEVIGLQQELFYPVRKGRHLEKIGFLLSLLYFAVAFGTAAVFIKLGFRPEGFTGRTVKTFIGAFIYVPLLIQLLKNFLHLLFMILVGCTDESVIRSIHGIADRTYFLRHTIHKLFRRNSRFLRL